MRFSAMRRKKTKVDIKKLLRQYEKQKERTKKYLQSVEKKTLVLCKKDKFHEIAKYVVANSLGKSYEYMKDEDVKKEVDEITKLLLTIAVAEKKLKNEYNLSQKQIEDLINEVKLKL